MLVTLVAQVHVLACLHVLGMAKCGSQLVLFSLNWILHLLLHVSLPPGLYFSHPLIIFSTYQSVTGTWLSMAGRCRFTRHGGTSLSRGWLSKQKATGCPKHPPPFKGDGSFKQKILLISFEQIWHFYRTLIVINSQHYQQKQIMCTNFTIPGTHCFCQNFCSGHFVPVFMLDFDCVMYLFCAINNCVAQWSWVPRMSRGFFQHMELTQANSDPT